jgi:L-ascorbate metabolism protein UlaG (beta-lactamase superfamily)
MTNYGYNPGMSASNQITYIGHATVLIELDGVRLLTDPLLRHRIVHLRRRRPYPTFDNLSRLDAVLLSHHHRDHLDIPSLKKLGRETRLIGPPGTASILKKVGFTRVDELAVGDRLTMGDVTIEAVFADHFSQRTPMGASTECVGFIVQGHTSIYFAGDTDLYPEMEAINVGIALMPIWGWGPTLGDGHMDPETAAKALALIQPKVAIPIHWGTFHPIGFGWLNPVFLTLPPVTFTQHAAELAPDVSIHVLPPGHSLEIDHTLRLGDQEIERFPIS